MRDRRVAPLGDTMQVARRAWRDALAVDFALAAPWAGLLRALPVAGLFAFGLAIGDARVALTLAIGANLVAVASLTGSARSSFGIASADTVAIAAATFAGAATAWDTPLHLGVLAASSFGAGTLVALGIGPATVGVQSVIAFVVFGRFVESAGGALGLAGLVAAGAAVETAVLLVLRLPPTLRVQRLRLAIAYRRLADLARAGAGVSSVPAAEALDAAAAALDRPGLFGRADVRTLRALIDEGRRMRVELSALAGLGRRLAGDRAAFERALEVVGETLSEFADEIAEPVLASRRYLRSAGASALDALAEATVVHNDTDDEVLDQASAHLDAVRGQIRAAHTAFDASSPVRTPRGPIGWGVPMPTFGHVRDHVAAEFALVRGALRPGTTSFRHAIRLGVAVPLSGVVAAAIGLPRSYWVPFAVVAVLKPDYSTLFRRGLGRVVGTILGATLGALVVGGLHPDTVWLVVLGGLSAWAAYSLSSASFAVSTALVTTLVLVLLSTTQVDTITTALDRLVDTVLGGSIALAIYALWPSSSAGDAQARLAELVGTSREYLAQSLALLTRGGVDIEGVSATGRRVRVAWGQAEAAVGRALDEPRRHRLDREFAAGTLVATRRVIQGTHSLRVEAERGQTVDRSGALSALGEGLDRLLGDIGRETAHDAVALALERPRLRAAWDEAAAELAAEGAPPVVALQLDEIVDATNSLAALVLAHRVRLQGAAVGDAAPSRWVPRGGDG